MPRHCSLAGLFAFSFGADAPFALTNSVSVVSTFRARVVTRSLEARYQDGLGRWLVGAGVGVRVGF